MAEEGDPQAQAMCDDIKANGTWAERPEGGVHHRRANSISGFVKARAEFPGETKPNKKGNNFSNIMSPQEFQDALSAGEVGALCGIASFLKSIDEAIDLYFFVTQRQSISKDSLECSFVKKKDSMRYTTLLVCQRIALCFNVLFV